MQETHVAEPMLVGPLAADPAALLPALRSHALILQAAVLNLAAAGLAAAAWQQDLVRPIFAGDSTYQCHLIAGVFAFGLVLALGRALQLSTELARLDLPEAKSEEDFLAAARRLNGQGRAALAGTLRLALASRVAGVRHIGNLLVLLGLIGTVVGFIMALGGVDAGEVGDPSAIGPMVAQLIEGMGVALNTTLLGAVLNIWLGLNARLIEAGCVRLFGRLVERAEAMHRA